FTICISAWARRPPATASRTTGGLISHPLSLDPWTARNCAEERGQAGVAGIPPRLEPQITKELPRRGAVGPCLDETMLEAPLAHEPYDVKAEDPPESASSMTSGHRHPP